MLSQMSLRQVVRQWDIPMLLQMSLEQVVRQLDHPNIVTDVPGTSSGTMGSS